MTLKDALIVAGIAALMFGARWAARTAAGATATRASAQTQTWVLLAVAASLVVWAVLDAAGITHESPWRAVRTYIGGAAGAVVLIVIGVGSLMKRS